MKIILVPFVGNSSEKNIDYKISFNEIAKQYSLLKANEDGKSDFSEIIEVDDIDKLSEYVKDHSVLIGADNKLTIAAFKHFIANSLNAGTNVGLISFDARCSSLELVKIGTINPNEIIFIGTRSWSKEEVEYIRGKKINYFNMKKLFEFGIDEATDTIMEFAREFTALYASIDISCMDPAYVNGAAKQEPGGLSSRELIYMLQRLKLLKNLKIVDITGFSEERDEKTIKLAAKIMKELS